MKFGIEIIIQQRPSILGMDRLDFLKLKNQQIKYDSIGNVIQLSNRKEVLIFERIFTKYGSPWYEYQSILLDFIWQ